jgi:hypothetical protein
LRSSIRSIWPAFLMSSSTINSGQHEYSNELTLPERYGWSRMKEVKKKGKCYAMMEGCFAWDTQGTFLPHSLNLSV